MFQTDVSKLEEIEKLKVEIESSLGTVDILINNAGIFLTKDITVEKPEVLTRMVSINLMAHLWVSCVVNEKKLVLSNVVS